MSRLICMRLADMHRVHPEQDNSRVCPKCGERLGIYPSGQAALKEDPALEIICQVCDAADPNPTTEAKLAPGAEKEPFESVSTRETNAAVSLSWRIRPLLAGQPPEVVGAALADLVSLLIAGHLADTPAHTRRMREGMVESHIKAVRKLIPIQEAMIIEQRAEAAKRRPN